MEIAVRFRWYAAVTMSNNKRFKAFAALVTAAAMALGLDALARGPIGIPDHSIVAGSLGSAGCLAAILAFASIIGRSSHRLRDIPAGRFRPEAGDAGACTGGCRPDTDPAWV